MSGYSETVDCPRCGSVESLERSVDHDDVSGYCIECGYEYSTVHTMMTIEEVNADRVESDMELLTELKKPVEGWTDED